MIWLLVGLLFFFSAHCVRIIADEWRIRVITVKGIMTWKALYSIVSLLGLILIVIGYGASRADPVFLWNPPVWTRHAAALLVLFAFILLAAANIPANHFKAKLGHPMYAGVKLWAFAHLIANGRLGDVVLFGTFLVWSIVGFSAARRRDRKASVTYLPGTAKGTTISVVAGFIGFAVFAMFLHRLLIGVPPF